MPSLRQLLAEQDEASSPNVHNLEKRVVLQQAALNQALDALAAARARQGEPPDLDPPDDLPFPTHPPSPRLTADQVRATAELILRSDRRRRAEEAIPAAPYVPLAAQPSTPEARADVASFILAAAKKARNEK